MHETPIPRLSRRSFLTRSLLVGLGVAALPAAGTLTACSSEPPAPDDRLLGALGGLRALDRDGADGGAGLFAGQADRLSAEIVRQCGTDADDTCTTAPDTVPVPSPAPSVADLRGELATVLPDAADSGQASLLTGMLAALATVDDTTAGGAAVDWTVVDRGLSGDVPDELGDATSRIHEAVWLTGRVLPLAGASADAVTTVAGRLRRIRDAAVAATDVPAAAGYTFPGGTGAPTDATAAVGVLLTAVHAVTVDLRRAAAKASGDDRVTVAMWCAVSARCEAALEDRAGTDPLSVPVRGE